MKNLVVDGEEGFYFLPFSLLSEFQEFCKQNSSKNTPPPPPTSIFPAIWTGQWAVLHPGLVCLPFLKGAACYIRTYFSIFVYCNLTL